MNNRLKMAAMMVTVSAAVGLALGACAADAESALTAKDRRILAYLNGTPSETEAPRDILVNKPDYVVYVPKQPRKPALRDPAKTGDTYKIFVSANICRSIRFGRRADI